MDSSNPGPKSTKKEKDVQLAAAKSVRSSVLRTTHSINFVNSFTPIRLLLQICGRLPFHIETNEKGVSSFHFTRMSAATFHFGISSFAATIPFVLIYMGFCRFLANYNDDKTDQCGYTWESTMWARHIVPITHTITWLGLSFLSSIYMFFEGQTHAHYFNYWNRALKTMDMDVTAGLKKFGVITNAQLAISALIVIIIFSFHSWPVLYDSAGMIAHFTIEFFTRDIYKSTLKPGNQRTKDYYLASGDFSSYYGWTWFGFIIQLYSFFGARTFLVEYQFFTKALENASKIWNERFTHVLHLQSGGVVEFDEHDQTKRRLALNLLLKDHLIIVKLFKMTEATFQWILVLFYFAQMANMFVGLYFISQIGGLDSCNKQISLIESQSASCVDSSSDTGYFRGERYLEQGDETTNHVYEAIVAITLFITTFSHFWNVTTSSADVFEEAMRGFRILRTHVYTSCHSRKERNFIHSLATSFAKNNPIGINGGGYFQISRETILLVYGGVMTCYIILIQTRPSSIIFSCVPQLDNNNFTGSGLSARGGGPIIL